MRHPRAILAVIASVLVLVAVLVVWPNPQGPGDGDPPGGTRSALLIPGYGGEQSPLDPLGTQLADDGYDVTVLDIGTGTGDLRDYAAQAVEQARALRADGATAVSTVGFSAGGLIGRIAAESEPGLFTDVISLAAPHEGTAWALLGGSDCPPACQQMKPGSELLASLPAAPDSATWLSLYSTTDEVIVPATSSALPGATVRTLQQACPDRRAAHGQFPADPWVVAAVSSFLAGQPLPTACVS